MKVVMYVGLVWLLILGSCQPRVSVEVPEELDENIRKAQEVRILYSDSAQLRMVLSSPNLEWEDGRNEKLQFYGGVHVEFYDEQEYKIADLWSLRATRIPREGMVVVEDSVILMNDKGDKLETNLLHWDEREQRAYTDRFVKISKGDERFFGFGFEAKDDFSTFAIKELTGKMNIKRE